MEILDDRIQQMSSSGLRKFAMALKPTSNSFQHWLTRSQTIRKSLPQMKVWKQTSSTNSLIKKFNIGKYREMDLRLEKLDVLRSIGHVQMLGEVNTISTEEAKQLIDQLNLILTEIESGLFSISEHCEDIHSQIEFQLTEKLGDDRKKVHAARSRNDHSLLDIKLYILHEQKMIESLMENVFTSLIHLARKHEHALLPGYSHYQLAMQSSFGLWFSA